MCGRYALGIRASFVRYQFQQQGLPVDDAPDDDVARETYNFPPGAYGLVYRADAPENAAQDAEHSAAEQSDVADAADDTGVTESDAPPSTPSTKKQYKHKLQAMKWGLIPFWTKRSPDYGSMMRTINCRDDSLIENRGMWNTMKQRKRCIVICQGFYEWLKKDPSGRHKVPHFVKRKDGHLMCFAGLWDCVRYEDAKENEKLYTYSIITTDSNKQLKFLHDRMPVILDPGTEAWNMWLDPDRNKWSKDLQSLLKPYKGELECYPVSQEVGKVGNNSPDFIVPIDSKENKKNIANFFGGQKSGIKSPVKKEENVKVKHEAEESRATTNTTSTEDNAPLPEPVSIGEDTKIGQKREREEDDGEADAKAAKKTRSAVKNEPVLRKSPTKKSTAADGTQRITAFFGT